MIRHLSSSAARGDARSDLVQSFLAIVSLPDRQPPLSGTGHDRKSPVFTDGKQPEPGVFCLLPFIAVANALRVNGSLTKLDVRVNNLGNDAEDAIRKAVEGRDGFALLFDRIQEVE